MLYTHSFSLSILPSDKVILHCTLLQPQLGICVYMYIACMYIACGVYLYAFYRKEAIWIYTEDCSHAHAIAHAHVYYTIEYYYSRNYYFIWLHIHYIHTDIQYDEQMIHKYLWRIVHSNTNVGIRTRSIQQGASAHILQLDDLSTSK